MTTPQHKIGSGFGASSTAAEVMAGIDLTGRLAIVTGGYSGIGLVTTRALQDAGAHVIVPARRSRQALQRVTAEVHELDLADLASVRAFAEHFLASDRRIDLLINNAGIMACPETRVGPGWEAQFATNHLGHYALVGHLWQAIAPGARIVAVSSRGHHVSGIHWDDVQLQRRYHKWVAYGQSKTANALFALHLDKLAEPYGIRAFSTHPGTIKTALQRHMAPEEKRANGWLDDDGDAPAPGFKTPEQGAATSVWAATSPALTGMGGAYCEDCDIAEPAPEGLRTGVKDHASDPVQAARLWALSAELTGIDPFR